MQAKDIKKYKLPASPGVYFFLGQKGAVLYIGKAGSLRDRVRSYFGKDIFVMRSPSIEKMVDEARSVVFQKTNSVLEALILEANLIKKHKPKYNTRDKDDKSFNYVVVTDEPFPRILTMRGKELLKNNKINLQSAICNLKSIYGPFPQGGVLKEALKIVRKIFPFRDTCLPRESASSLRKSALLKPCFNRQIGLCPGICTGEISKLEYQKTVQNLRLLFGGKKAKLLKKLTCEMKGVATKQEFERAVKLRNMIFSLKHIQDISLIKHPRSDIGLVYPQSYQHIDGEKTVDKSIQGPTLDSLRIEGYDVAHMAGSEIVGVMVVLTNGEPEKSEYRKFKLRTITSSNDPGALGEIIERRMKHVEWGSPQLIVVDGGKAQVNVAKRLLDKESWQTSVVGVVKDERHRPKKIIGDKSIITTHEKEILLANHEAHRFALAYHKKRLRKNLKNN